MSLGNLTKLKRKAAELEQKKQFGKALQLYIQVIDEAGRDLEDADLQLFNRVGDLLLRAGTVSEALAYYEKAVDMYAERGFLNNAIALCNKILRQSPARAAVYYKLGKISASKGFKSDAKKNFLEYADRMQKGGQVEEAFRALKEFAELCPDQDDIRLMLADLLTKENRSGEALVQLERLYHKLDAEGRDAEARATLDRIKAIDPNMTLQAFGSVESAKENELVFLDLSEVAAPGPSRTPRPLTPVSVAPPVTAPLVIAALEGLTLTFMPDEEPASSGDGLEPTPEGFEATASDESMVLTEDEVSTTADLVVDHIETVESLVAAEQQDLQSLDDGTAPDDVVPHIEGLESSKVAVAGVDALLTPLVDEPPLLSEEFADLRLVSRDTGAHQAIPHDLALSSSLPILDADPLAEMGEALEDVFDTEDSEPAEPTPGSVSALEDGATPGDWVAAALSAPRNDLNFDRFLTPLDSLVIPGEPGSNGSGASYAEVLLDGEPLAATPAALESVPEFLDVADASSEEAQPVAAAPEDVQDAVAAVREEAELVEMALSAAAAEAAGQLAQESGRRELADDIGAIRESAEASRTWPEADDLGSWELSANGPGIPQLEETTLLDLSSLHDLPDRPVLGRAGPQGRDGDFVSDVDQSELIQSAFSESEVSLPLIEIDGVSHGAADTDGGTFDPSDSLADILSSPPAFGEPAHDPDFLPAPPLGMADDWSSSEVPEVLIDGEWRDEHVGDLVSGERDAISPLHHSPRSSIERPVFDDLAAAMMYTGEDEDPTEGSSPGHGGERVPTPASPKAFSVRATPPRSTLSFGGVEAQLRRRLDLDPTNWGLKRLLGEALLDQGDREQGLNALDEAMRGYEAEADLTSARGVVDVILQVVPLSVRHHQKRVEYAVRANDRVQLVEAYAELADALFRCGDAGKSRVVYSRVLELAPTFERARLALQLLDGGRHQVGRAHSSSPTASRVTTPSVDLATLSADRAEDAMPTLEQALALPLLDEEAAPSLGDADHLDEEIDSAFDVGGERTKPPWAPTPPPSDVAHVSAADHSFLDLGDWAREATPERSTRMVANDVAPTGDEEADFEEMLRRFKKGLAENVDEEDYASHYDLGIAFKEMGLIDEAISQFQKALRGDTQRVRAYEALGQCFVEKGQHQVATTLLKRAIETVGADDRQLVGVLYLLGYSSEALARHAEAASYYQRVFAVDVEFRDAATRLAAIERQLR